MPASKKRPRSETGGNVTGGAKSTPPLPHPTPSTAVASNRPHGPGPPGGGLAPPGTGVGSPGARVPISAPSLPQGWHPHALGPFPGMRKSGAMDFPSWKWSLIALFCALCSAPPSWSPAAISTDDRATRSTLAICAPRRCSSPARPDEASPTAATRGLSSTVSLPTSWRAASFSRCHPAHNPTTGRDASRWAPSSSRASAAARPALPTWPTVWHPARPCPLPCRLGCRRGHHCGRRRGRGRKNGPTMRSTGTALRRDGAGGRVS